MTFFTLLYHSGDDGAVVTPPPTVSGPGSVGGYEPRRERADKRNKKLGKDSVPRLERYVKGVTDLYDPGELDLGSYEAVAAKVEALAREAADARLKLEARELARALAKIEEQERFLRERLIFLENEEEIALLLLMS